jgi:hypothetical protein
MQNFLLQFATTIGCWKSVSHMLIVSITWVVTTCLPRAEPKLYTPLSHLTPLYLAGRRVSTLETSNKSNMHHHLRCTTTKTRRSTLAPTHGDRLLFRDTLVLTCTLAPITKHTRNRNPNLSGGPATKPFHSMCSPRSFLLDKFTEV